MLNQALVLKSKVSSGFAITDIETLKVWFKFNTGQGAIADGIQWDDSSGNNNHASQTADAQEGSGFSGGGFVTDSDNNDNLDFSTTFTDSGDYHVFMVLDLSEENSETFISSADNTSFMRFAQGGTAEAFRMKNGGTTLNITLSSGFGTTKAIAEVTRNSSNVVRVLKNGVSLGSGTGSGTFGFEQIGASSGASSLTTATIFEVVIFSSALSSADATKVRNDIADRNSISL
jgi:hypothetical protein|tara:strand:+ start:295 stop:987 length:693 start_codon:yes stop_codon:yes gene_type:complete